MKLSVIVPVYNVDTYLRACVESIIAQSYKDLEIILVDDGSTDDSSRICDELRRSDDRIVVIHKENGGVSSARNEGLNKAQGDLITFVDSDDTIDAEMYKTLVYYLEKNNLDIVHCSYKRLDEEGIKCIGNTSKFFLQNRMDGLNCLITGHLFVGGMWNKIYKRALINDIRLNENLIINEDVLFNVQAFDKAKLTGFLDISFYNYFVRTISSATNTTKEIIKARDFAFVSEYIYENILDEELRAVTTNKYVNLYCNLYRCEKNKQKRKMIVKKVFDVDKSLLNFSNKVSIYLIKFFPLLYKFIYGVYDKIRKPNWDVK